MPTRSGMWAPDLLHKAVYAAVTGAVYDAMTADSQ
jgi:hypothetical protein